MRIVSAATRHMAGGLAAVAGALFLTASPGLASPITINLVYEAVTQTNRGLGRPSDPDVANGATAAGVLVVDSALQNVLSFELTGFVNFADPTNSIDNAFSFALDDFESFGFSISPGADLTTNLAIGSPTQPDAPLQILFTNVGTGIFDLNPSANDTGILVNPQNRIFGLNTVIGNEAPNGLSLTTFFTILPTGEVSGLQFINFRLVSATVAPTEVPLPAAAWVFLAGLGGLSALRRRRARPA